MSRTAKSTDLSLPVRGTLSGKGKDRKASWRIAEEVPLVLFYNGERFGVMMASPADLEDFATGFSLSEGIAASIGDIRDIRQEPLGRGVALNIIVKDEALSRAQKRRRALAGTSSCAICGTESIEEALFPLPRTRGFVADGTVALAALEALEKQQSAGQRTRSCHSAGLADKNGNIILLRQDIGRHNALDKLLGAMARAGLGGEDGFGVLTSRFSLEMAQKAAMAGFSFVATLSSPTTLALETAKRAGMRIGVRADEGIMIFE